jgi:predicted nucleotidyltransferase
MVEIPEEISQKINRFIDYLENTGIHIETAILFGSYAKGEQNKWSDIDLALVSKMFEGNRYYDLDKLTDACFAIDTNISPLPYTPDDFNSNDLFVKEILKNGIRVC